MKYKVTIDIEVKEQEGFEPEDVIIMIEQVIGIGVAGTHLSHARDIRENTVNEKRHEINYDIIKGMSKAIIESEDMIESRYLKAMKSDAEWRNKERKVVEDRLKELSKNFKFTKPKD